MNAAVIEAVRVPPSAFSTSASTGSCRGPGRRSTMHEGCGRSTAGSRSTDRRRRGGFGRASCRVASRIGREPAERFSLEKRRYRVANRAVTSTAVAPQRYSTLPGLLRMNPRSMVTGRRSSFFRPLALFIRKLYPFVTGERRSLNRCSPSTRAKVPSGNGHGWPPAGAAGRTIEHFRCHFLAAVRRQTVHEDDVARGAGQQAFVHLERGEDSAVASASFSWPMLAQTSV